MHIVSTAITGTIKKGELQTEQALSVFPDGTEVIIIERQGWNQIAGSDHARHRAQVAEQALEAISKIPLPEKSEQVKEIVEQARGAKK